MQRDPPPFVWAAPDEKDILTCVSIFSHLIMDGILTPPLCLGNFVIVRNPHAMTAVLVADVPSLSQHGPPDSPYVGGEYHGVLLFPSEYPFKPPGIKVGRVALAFGSPPR